MPQSRGFGGWTCLICLQTFRFTYIANLWVWFDCIVDFVEFPENFKRALKIGIRGLVRGKKKLVLPCALHDRDICCM